MRNYFVALAFLAATPVSFPAYAQDVDWERWSNQDGMVVSYAVRKTSDGFRVAWRCENFTTVRLSCSVGAGENKEYGCYRGSVKVGTTGALGEQATVRPGGTYTFLSEPACRGLNATSVHPFARISIEKN